MDFLYICPSLWCGCKLHASEDYLLLDRSEEVPENLMSCVWGQKRGFSFLTLLPVSGCHFQIINGFVGQGSPLHTAADTWMLCGLCGCLGAYYYRTAVLLQDKHCGTEQFNQQRAENKEENKIETTSGVCSVCAEQFLGLKKEHGLPPSSSCEVWR